MAVSDHGWRTSLHVEGVDVDRSGTWYLTELSPPVVAAVSTMRPVQAVVDSGSYPTSMSERVARNLHDCFPSVPVMEPMKGAHHVRMADGSLVPTTKMSCPSRVALNTE